MRKAEIILKGNIKTLDPKMKHAEAVAIADKKILSVGPWEEVSCYLTDDTTILNFGDKIILPSFTDCHNHPVLFSRLKMAPSIEHCETLKQAIAIVKDTVKHSEPELWNLFYGWNNTKFIVTKSDLDQISKYHKIAVLNLSLHGWVLNSAALDSVEWDMGIGNFDYSTGFIAEDYVFQVLRVSMGPVDALLQPILNHQDELLALGITHCIERDVFSLNSILACQKLDQKNKLLLDIHAYAQQPILAQTNPFYGNHFRLEGLKMFADGAFGVRTACMSNPYHDDHDNTGIMLIDDDRFDQDVRYALDNGFCSVCIHCIGDAACEFTIRAFERWKTEIGSDIKQWSWEHFVLPYNFLSRARDIGAIASVQPNGNLADIYQYGDRLGERTKFINPLQGILDHGIPMIFGSDGMPSSPLLGIACACDPNLTDIQKIGMEEALRCYIAEPAKIMGEWDIRGSITPGKKANMVVLNVDLDPLVIKQRYQQDHGDQMIDMTIKEGQIVFQRHAIKV